MPVRNEASLLSGCLEDIFSQTLSEIELVIVDDGSTDTTAELLKEASQSCLLYTSPSPRDS